MTEDGMTGAQRVLQKEAPSADVSPEDVFDLAADAGLSEDAALALLRRADLPAQILERLGKNGNVLKHRKVKLALVEHPKTPRHVSLPLIRQLYTFDLMQVALTLAVPADVQSDGDGFVRGKADFGASGFGASRRRVVAGSRFASDAGGAAEFALDGNFDRAGADETGADDGVRGGSFASSAVVAPPRGKGGAVTE
jgi:hypothetical protein